ncbi:MAG: TRAP transporter substrate-binding protein [Clostridia bacterium]|nr:TRAP transporter substrate-binding protein [Clostridia bacterium]
MKGKISAIVLVMSALLLLVGCSSKEAPKTTDKAAAEPVKLRLLTEYSLKDKRGQLVQDFASKVEQETKGQVKIEIYPDGQLYKSSEHIEAVSSGSVEMAVTHFGKGWPQAVPELMILGSGVFDNSAHAMKALDGPLGTKLEKLLEEKAKTKLLGWTGAGNVDAMGATKKQIKKPEDIKGLKMRVPSPSQTAYVEALGGAGVVINPSEAYLALQNGTIDGVFSTTPSGVVMSKLYEVTKFWTRVRLAVGVEHGIVINQDAFNKLPQDVQKVLGEVAKESGKTLISELEAAGEQEWEAVAKSQGVQVYRIPEAELAIWKEKLAPARLKVLEKALPKETVKELMDLAAQAK